MTVVVFTVYKLHTRDVTSRSVTIRYVHTSKSKISESTIYNKLDLLFWSFMFQKVKYILRKQKVRCHFLLGDF